MIKKHRMMFTVCFDVAPTLAAKLNGIKSHEDALALFKEVSTNDHTIYAVDEEVYEIESEAVSNKEVEKARETADFGMILKASSKVVVQQVEFDMAQAKSSASKIVTLN